eukprot:6891006-Prymnesium_polylepis.1
MVREREKSESGGQCAVGHALALEAPHAESRSQSFALLALLTWTEAVGLHVADAPTGAALHGERHRC